MRAPFPSLHRPVSLPLRTPWFAQRLPLALTAFRVLNAETAMNSAVVQQHVLGSMLVAACSIFILISTPGTNCPWN